MRFRTIRTSVVTNQPINAHHSEPNTKCIANTDKYCFSQINKIENGKSTAKGTTSPQLPLSLRTVNTTHMNIKCVQPSRIANFEGREIAFRTLISYPQFLAGQEQLGASLPSSIPMSYFITHHSGLKYLCPAMLALKANW